MTNWNRLFHCLPHGVDAEKKVNWCAYLTFHYICYEEPENIVPLCLLLNIKHAIDLEDIMLNHVLITHCISRFCSYEHLEIEVVNVM